jgi:hypothetical protein
MEPLCRYCVRPGAGSACRVSFVAFTVMIFFSSPPAQPKRASA